MPASTNGHLGIGIDFGTSNSSVALYDGKEVVTIKLEPQDAQGDMMPTALYMNRGGGHTIGQKAVNSYLQGEAGRVVKLTKEQTRDISITVSGTESSPGSRDNDGAITFTAHTHAFTDQGSKGRLFRSLKRWLGSKGVENIRVFDGSKRMVDLITLIIGHLKKETQQKIGNFESVYMGRPVQFEGASEESNKTALHRLKEAALLAGIKSTIHYPEPVAASLSYLQSKTPLDNETILTFDYGGGTLDLCVLKTKGTKFDILGIHGVGLGGDEIDRLIYTQKVFPELGENCSLQIEGGDPPRTARFPFHAFSNGLLNWQLTHELNRPELKGDIARGIQQGGETAKKLARLKKLVTNNLSYVVFQAVERAKIELSEKTSAKIEVPKLDLSVEIKRSEFEKMLAETLDEIEESIQEVLRRAKISAKDITTIVCTGGSSQIPLVKKRLEKIIPQQTIEHRVFTSIAAGLAIASYHKYQSPLN